MGLGQGSLTAATQPDMAPDNAIQASVEALTKQANSLQKWPADARTNAARQYVLSAIMVLRGISLVNDDEEVAEGAGITADDMIAALGDDEAPLSIGHGIPGVDEEGKEREPFSPMVLPDSRD